MHFSQLAPPPPYAPPLSEVLLDSPIPVTAHLVTGAALSPDGPSPPRAGSMEEWMDEKSREELSGLLLKADGIIKTRETELSYTSALCKSLYDDNVTLKTKHEALIARLPGTGVTSPAPSVPTSPRLDSSTAGRSSSFSGIMFPASSEESLQPVPPAFRMRHHRRISVTPAELANLADQNAELLDKLEKLENESLRADQAGKRKLRKLEQEIQSLREELDRTQAKGAELEEQAKAAVNAVHAQHLKEEREAWRRAVKEKSASLSASDSSGAEVRDFAPPSELPQIMPRRRLYIGSESSDPDISGSSSDVDASFEQPSFDTDQQEDDDAPGHDSFFSDPSLPDIHHSLPDTEFALISQLLSKIRELEETNTQIIEQQKLTEERMRAAQWDADSIRRVYDCLDIADIDIDDSEEVVQPSRSRRVPSGGTIRFSSLRRTLIGDLSRLLSSEESLGSEIGEEWPERGYNHHLRASSLYDLAGLNSSQSMPGSPAESHAHPSFTTPRAQDESFNENVAGPSTPPRAPVLQLNIEPPTPTPDRLRSPAVARQQRLSQTVRARTNRWVEGRFQQEGSRDSILRKRQSSSTLGRRSSTKGKTRSGHSQEGSGILDETFDDAVLHVKRARSRASLAALGFPPSSSLSPQHSSESPVEEEESPVEADRSIELRRLSQGDAAAVADPIKREGIVGFVLEAWLWLQFAVVVMLFLWAMAKRGPKVVLEAERRGASHRGAGP
ncbi:hypothetical protein FKP32DRAFT_1587015 [Trametes sanguinea]|nr:hypothetical protein FKP32DRAFT_1587015 [Trametes sanguinea]